MKKMRYANSLLMAVEFLAYPAIRPPVMASEINSGGFLERRFQMIVSKPPNRVNLRLQGLVLLFAVVVLPLGVVHAQDTKAKADAYFKQVWAKLACELGTVSDLLKVTGGTLTGSGPGGVSVSVADSGGLVVGNTYDLIDWTGATLNGVDVGDFVADMAGEYVGTFNISGSPLQITITGLVTTPTAGTTATVAKTTTTTCAANTWINPSGGNWKDSANWYGGVIPNGAAKNWVQYSFEKPRKVSSVDVYWLDDKGRYRVPASWRVLYRLAGEWKPVEAVGEYGVAKDRFNEVHFKPIETDALRLEVKLQPNYSGGILEWRVNP